MERYGPWIGTAELVPPRLVRDDEAIDLALAGGDWIGLAVYIYAWGSWTVFEELSGGLAARPAADWLQLADGGDLVYAGYNDAISYGELVRVDAGQLVRRFLQDEQDPSANVDVGKLPEEAAQPFVNWTDVAKWVDEEVEELGSDQGWLWIHRAA
jgi:hypothetical protein